MKRSKSVSPDSFNPWEPKGTPPKATPSPRNKTLIKGNPWLIPLIRPYLLEGVALGEYLRFPWSSDYSGFCNKWYGQLGDYILPTTLPFTRTWRTWTIHGFCWMLQPPIQLTWPTGKFQPWIWRCIHLLLQIRRFSSSFPCWFWGPASCFQKKSTTTEGKFHRINPPNERLP